MSSLNETLYKLYNQEIPVAEAKRQILAMVRHNEQEKKHPLCSYKNLCDSKKYDAGVCLDDDYECDHCVIDEL